MLPSSKQAIIAYLRTLKTIQNDVPPSKAKFPMNFIMRIIPKMQPPGKQPAQTDTVQYGQYLAQIASCRFCHTPMKKERLIMEKEFTGDMNFLYREISW